MNRYFDIALNLASERFSGERDKVIADALTRNVNYFNIVCSSLNELDFVKDLHDRYKQNSCFTLGVHPHNANELNGNTLNSLKNFLDTLITQSFPILCRELSYFGLGLPNPIIQRLYI